MIITITGKPCSGKSVVIEYLIEKYGFERFSAGQIFRKIATERGLDVLELNRINDTSVDKLVDDEVTRIGQRDIEKNIIFDSRTAWHFIPNSFKVFLDVQEEEQITRLLNSGRKDEKTDLSREEARNALNERWNLENDRYRALYDFDNRNLDNYDFVVDTSNLSIEDSAEKIYDAYLKFVEKR